MVERNNTNNRKDFYFLPFQWHCYYDDDDGDEN